MTDRSSAATPEEERIIGGWRSHMPSGGRDQDGWTTVTDDELLDLIRRAQAAQAPRVLKPTDPYPEIGSVILDGRGKVWLHVVDESGIVSWLSSDGERSHRWGTFFTTLYGPVTLIHDAAAAIRAGE